jgi:hypothetical protein
MSAIFGHGCTARSHVGSGRTDDAKSFEVARVCSSNNLLLIKPAPQDHDWSSQEHSSG